MIVYHGSTVIVDQPQIFENQKLVDFGRGFYTTSNQLQAENWAKIKRQRLKVEHSYINSYQFDENILLNGKYKTLIFENANEKWLQFVINNRRNLENHQFDLVKGAVANDTLYLTLTLFETGILNEVQTIERLKTHLLFDQISFHNEEILKELKFVSSLKL